MTRWQFVVASASLTLVFGCSGGEETSGVPEEVIRENILGTAYLGQQDWDEASAAFRRGLAMLEGEPLLLNNLAVALIQKGDPEQAETHLRQALDADPDYPFAHYNLGLIEADRGNFAEAAERFEAVAKVDAEDVVTQYNLGEAYSNLGRGEDAETAWRRALEIDPDHVSSMYALGRRLVAKGDRDSGIELIKRSRQIQARSGLDVGVGSQYGEQGPYALGVDYAGDALSAPPAIDVTFETAQRHETGSSRLIWTLTRTEPDGKPVVVVADGPSAGTLTIDGGFKEIVPAAPGEAVIVALSAGDGDKDGVVELYALLGGDGAGTRPAVIEQDDAGTYSWRDEGAFAGSIELPETVAAADLTLVDREHDGDLDLFWCWSAATGSGCGLGTNDGSGNFRMRSSTEHGFELHGAGADRLRVAFSDLDNDHDIDLLVGENGGIHVYANLRDGNFRDVGQEIGLGDRAAGFADFAVADIDKDGWMDLIVGGEKGLLLFANRRGRFTPQVPLAGHSEAVDAVAVLDADNDGFLDILVSSEAGEARAYRNREAGEWDEAKGWLEAVPQAAPVAAWDADGDGDLDLLSARAGAAALLSNQGGNANRWISVESRGQGDNRFGIGAKVEILAGALRQKFEVVRPLPIHAGLGGRDRVDSVRHLWPNGVLQDEVLQEAGGVVEVTQLDRKGTSCPLLYAWRDGKWHFVTDFLGGSAIGYQVSPGVFSTPDTDEYVKLEHGPTVEADGRLKLRINNQLQEIIWFDQVKLVAVDHPQGTEAFPNERLMPRPPWPGFELFISDDIRPVVAARGIEDDSDLANLLAERDRLYVDNFELLPFKGYAELHTIELDLGRFADEQVILLLDGWIDYADSTANVGAHQAGLRLVPPALTIADGRGGWKTTGHLMGFPAGLPKTMAVDLTGRFPSSDHRVRIATNMRVYWDRVRVMVSARTVERELRHLPPRSAELRAGGFPAETSPDRRKPFGYDPAQVSALSPWRAHVGRYTAFGDVTALLAELDDRLVTTRSGDEIELIFDAPPPPRQDWTRTYLLYADGFGKDMDPNSAANAEVGPIPFHGMPSYPYPEGLAPPVTQIEGTRARLVIDSERGWPGAVPLPLATD